MLKYIYIVEGLLKDERQRSLKESTHACDRDIGRRRDPFSTRRVILTRLKQSSPVPLIKQSRISTSPVWCMKCTPSAVLLMERPAAYGGEKNTSG